MMIWTFILVFAGAVALGFLPRAQESMARWVALGTTLAGAVVAVAGFFMFDRSAAAPAFQFVVQQEWIPAIGATFHLGVDGISLVLLLLTAIVSIAGVLFSWNVVHRPRAFFACYLAIIGAVYGVFQSLDVFLLFVFYEIVIIPKYLLIAFWGSTNKEYGAMKLTLYSVGGSALVLVGILAAFAASGAGSFGLLDLAAAEYSPGFQAWAFPVLFLGFAVLAGLWPFHSWAPTGHVAAPTAASMLLAGVVMKLGSYGALRVAMPLFPEGLEMWRMAIAVLAVIGILYGALAALGQKDLKFVIGFSSVSHMGFVMLGLATLNVIGVGGAVLQMFSHGVIAGLLFAVAGRMVYDRTHTRQLAELADMRLYKAMPFAAVVFVAASAASMGLPGFSGFIAELSVLMGMWSEFPALVGIACIGVVVTAGFSINALQRTFFGKGKGELEDWEAMEKGTVLVPISTPEKAGAILLLTATVAVGLFPGPLVDLIMSGLNGPLMEVIFTTR
jgi:NADH-quinone oxidoreductase subunit M